jgi:hypothetical protein
MSYLARLKQKILEKAPECEATKGTKRAYVPFVAPMPTSSRQISAHKLTIDPEADPRRDRALAMLTERPALRYAVLAVNPDTDPVLLTVAIRGVATFDMAIPAAKFNAFALLALIERHGATVH